MQLKTVFLDRRDAEKNRMICQALTGDHWSCYLRSNNETVFFVNKPSAESPPPDEMQLELPFQNARDKKL